MIFITYKIFKGAVTAIIGDTETLETFTFEYRMIPKLLETSNDKRFLKVKKFNPKIDLNRVNYTMVEKIAKIDLNNMVIEYGIGYPNKPINDKDKDCEFRGTFKITNDVITKLQNLINAKEIIQDELTYEDVLIKKGKVNKLELDENDDESTDYI